MALVIPTLLNSRSDTNPSTRLYHPHATKRLTESLWAAFRHLFYGGRAAAPFNSIGHSTRQVARLQEHRRKKAPQADDPTRLLFGDLKVVSTFKGG
jgi:hypothetical protein